MSVHVLLNLLKTSCEKEIKCKASLAFYLFFNLLNLLRKRDKMLGLPRILSLFCNSFNIFNNTRARMLDSIYYMTLKLL